MYRPVLYILVQEKKNRKSSIKNSLSMIISKTHYNDYISNEMYNFNKETNFLLKRVHLVHTYL